MSSNLNIKMDPYPPKTHPTILQITVKTPEDAAKIKAMIDNATDSEQFILRHCAACFTEFKIFA